MKSKQHIKRLAFWRQATGMNAAEAMRKLWEAGK